MTGSEGMKLAREARKNAYAPYSHFAVGAALVCADGSVFCGVNVENSSFGATNCAERTALFAAIAEGKRKFTALYVVGGKENEEFPPLCMPCGICRQALSEFTSPDFPVFVGDGKETRRFLLKELLPGGFTLDH